MPANDDTADRVHDNVRNWAVHAETTEGDYEATVGMTTVTDLNRFDGKPIAEVCVFVSLYDGAITVQVNTHREVPVPVRMEINENRTPVFDETITP